MPDKAIFLDRDDTIIEDTGYINSPELVKLIPNAAAAIVELRKMGYKIIVVSNQSGIARGLLTEQTLAHVHERLKQLLAEHNAYLDRIYYCPYLPDGAIAKYRKDSDWRKPKPGMLLAASKEMRIDLDKSWMIGNAYIDIASGKSAGCRTILIKSPAKPPVKKADDPEPDFEAINLREAVNIIKREITPKKPAESPKPQTEPQPQTPPVEPQTEPAPEPMPKPQNTSQAEPHPVEQTKKTEEAQTIEQKIQHPEHHVTKTEHLLEEIKLILKSHHRTELFSEFSAMKLAGPRGFLSCCGYMVQAVPYRKR